MQYDDLKCGTLVKRYKRFLADVILEDGQEVTVHCPNTGSMKNCAKPGSRVWLTVSDNPKRKYPLGWELVEVEEQYLASINTGRANALIAEAIRAGVITQLQGYSEIRSEVKYGENSRIDLLLQDDDKVDTWVEIKNVTLFEGDGWGSFPDAVTARGAKHLQELEKKVAEGERAVMLFCVPHTGINRMRPADQIDPKYGQLLRKASQAGVEVYAYRADITDEAIEISHEIPVIL